MAAEAAETAAEYWNAPAEWAMESGPRVRHAHHDGGAPRPPRPPRPPRGLQPPAGLRWLTGGWDGPDRITERVEDLAGRFEEFRRRTEDAIGRLGREFSSGDDRK